MCMKEKLGKSTVCMWNIHTFLGFENSTCVYKKPAVVNMK
jgi:hypothetical protein